MTINKTTQDLSTLKINRLTQEMYDNALENDQINATELYLTDYDGIDSTEFPTSAKIAEFDASAKMNSTDMTSEEVTTLVNGLSFKNDVDMTQEELQTFLSNLNLYGINAVDYIVEQGTDGDWIYRKWNSGVAECWAGYSIASFAPTSSFGGTYYRTLDKAFPTGLFTEAPKFAEVDTYWDTGLSWGSARALSKDTIQYSVFKNSNSSYSAQMRIYAIGTWK